MILFSLVTVLPFGPVHHWLINQGETPGAPRPPLRTLSGAW